MTAVVHVKTRLIPWDDTAFVRAYEQAHAEVEASGCCPEGLDAAERVQHLLRERGYPDARVDVERSVDEALQHVAHWVVNRRG
jgi:hypothetical protein